MRGGGGVDCEAARVADIGDMVEQLQRVDELASRLAPALDLESDQRAIAALEIGVGPPLRLACSAS
jgi:hypothetical protein